VSSVVRRPEWAGIEGRPDVFPPTTHTHVIADITDYTPGEGGPHTHPTSDVVGLDTALAGKVATTDPRLSDARTPLTHGHTIGDTTGLQTALDGKSATAHNHDAAYSAIGHTHAQLHNQQHGITSSDHTFPGGTTNFLREDGTWAAPAGGPGGEAFPVGSVFVSVVATNPGTLLGYGTWAALGAGRVLVGVNPADPDFDAAKKTGGAKTSSAVVNHTHPVVVTDPGHAHVQGVNSTATGGLSGYTADTSTNTRVNSGYSTSSAVTGVTATTSNPAGGVANFSIMPPFLAVYFWERTA
jgi:hypothetical protein